MNILKWTTQYALPALAILAMMLANTTVFAQQNNNSPTMEDQEARVMARLKLASEYYTRNQIGSALRELNTARDIYDNYAPLHSMLGIVNMDLKRFDEAEKSFQKALKLDPQNPDIHNNYGWYLCNSGQYPKGIEWLSKAWNNPLYATPEKALYNAGRCSKMASDNPKAVEYFSKALTVSPKSTAVMYELANMQYEQGNYANVLDVVDKIHDIAGPSPQSLWLALKTENKLGHRDEVESYGKQLTRKFPNAAETTLWLRQILVIACLILIAPLKIK